MTYANLPGWFDYEQAYDDAVAAATDGAVFVELGVYAGRSLAYLAERVIASGKRIDVYGVDRFAEFSAACVRQSMRDFRVGDVVKLIESDSDRAARWFRDGSVDFVFLDADHSYEGVQKDIAAWRPKMKPGGVMAGHDLVREGVHKAVQEALGEYKAIGPLAWWVRV